LELQLRLINETKINCELEKNPNFALLNSERVTPFFLKMAKGCVQESSLAGVCDYDGQPFNNAGDQRIFIYNHFADSFKKNPLEPDSLEGCIENFLGEDILNHPIVRNLKLSIDERTRLEGPVTDVELDIAIDGANAKSAAGIDGINTAFIKRYWYIFRAPLVKYAAKAFNRKALMHSFKTAIIKLIPKKGDGTNIKKWRPISLLSCMYKILSRVVNNRLKSVINRFTSRVQKGFTNHRYIQEVLINVCEKISHCNNGNIGGALLSVDQSRAFDTISHKYMEQVFKFFGFGPEFINIMNTIGTGRTASIIFEDGSLSKPFDLESGRPQGDGPSPLQYNMGEEILLLKIELDPEIASVFQHQLLPRFALDLVPDPKRGGVDADYNDHFSQESTRETDKADSFADDNSSTTLANFRSLSRLNEVVFNFGNFSGLKSNAEKTTLLQIGNVNPLSQEIIGLGFNSVQEVVLLGMTINRDLSALLEHFTETRGKVLRIREYWERFNLSLPGRISVCKTFMLSQIGYLGCIITPTEAQFKALQKELDEFCLGPLRIAKKKLYLPVNEGGLGLINLKDYITALQCSWVKRVTQHWCDNWRYDIMEKCYGNPCLINGNTFNDTENPILSNIGKSFGKFKNEYYKKDKNYLKAFIFKNPMFQRSRDDNGILDEVFFGRNTGYDEFCKIAKIKFEDLFVRGGPKSLFETNREFGINLSLVTYMRLHEALEFYKNKKSNEVAGPAVSIKFFMKTFTRGSKPFRRILCFNEFNKHKIERVHTVMSFFEITGLPVPDPSYLKKCWGFWNKSYLGNKCREFLFKFYNNILGTNDRVAKFVQGRNPECTLCEINNEPRPRQAESFYHVFFACPHSSKIQDAVEKKFFPELNNVDAVKKKTFWFTFGLPSNRGTEYNEFVSAVVATTNYFIWTAKLQKNCLSSEIILLDLDWKIRKMLSASKKLSASKQNCNAYICRYDFFREGGRGVP